MSSPSSYDFISGLPISDRAKSDLSRRMEEPWRHYHTLEHLNSLWDCHSRHQSAVGYPEQRFSTLISLAIAYHDAVYVGGATDNETKSAALWLEVGATAEGLTEDGRLWVADTIRATADHIRMAAMLDLADASDYARQWTLDLDLTPLGALPETFDKNMVLLAAEMPHLSDEQQLQTLMSGLRYFATARPLYRCTTIANAFEETAQQNLSRHLGRPDTCSAEDASYSKDYVNYMGG